MSTELTPDQIAEGWIKHDGSGNSPVPLATVVEVHTPADRGSVGRAGQVFVWSVVDRYRVFSPVIPNPTDNAAAETRPQGEGREAFENITNNMTQLDEDGVFVSVSRQALESVLTVAAHVLYPECYPARPSPDKMTDHVTPEEAGEALIELNTMAEGFVASQPDMKSEKPFWDRRVKAQQTLRAFINSTPLTETAQTDRLTALKPDMFWDARDPEVPHDYATEVCQTYGHGVVCEVQRAVSVANGFAVTLPAADDADSDDLWEFEADTKAECESALTAELNRRQALGNQS